MPSEEQGHLTPSVRLYARLWRGPTLCLCPAGQLALLHLVSNHIGVSGREVSVLAPLPSLQPRARASVDKLEAERGSLE